MLSGTHHQFQRLRWRWFVTRRKVMRPRYGRRSPHQPKARIRFETRPFGGMDAGAALAGRSKVCRNCANLFLLAGRTEAYKRVVFERYGQRSRSPMRSDTIATRSTGSSAYSHVAKLSTNRGISVGG